MCNICFRDYITFPHKKRFAAQSNYPTTTKDISITSKSSSLSHLLSALLLFSCASSLKAGLHPPSTPVPFDSVHSPEFCLTFIIPYEFKNHSNHETLQPQPYSMTRRQFIRTHSSLLLLPQLMQISVDKPVLSMGLIADLHHGLAPDAMQRLEVFMKTVDEKKPDLLLQLGDFNFGRPDSKECMDLWRQFKGPRYHVLGNHDMDFFGKRHMLDSWEMPAPYYSFDRAGYHFIILDRNNLRTPEGYTAYDTANFYVPAPLRGHADPEQLEWLRADLANTNLPCLVFSHQGLGMPKMSMESHEARAPIERILSEALHANGTPKVRACFCGHHHLDRYNLKDGIHYVWINSASYYWVGEDYGRMAFYANPLFAFVQLYENGMIEIHGAQTNWESPTPKERNYPNPGALTTFISDRTFQ